MYGFQWLSEAGINKLASKQAILANQLPLLKNQPYTPDSENLESKLKSDMNSFSSGINHAQYHNIAKSAMMCLHLDTDGIEPTTEGDRQGWWLPLKKKFLAWRAMGLQEPMLKYMVTFGTLSITLNSEKDFLNVVFQAGQ